MVIRLEIDKVKLMQMQDKQFGIDRGHQGLTGWKAVEYIYFFLLLLLFSQEDKDKKK